MATKRAMRRKIQILQEKIDRLGSADGELVAWIRLRLLDDVVAIAEGVAGLEFDVVEREQPTRARELLRVMKDAGVHPWSVQAELAGLAGRLAEKPSVGDVVRRHLDGAVSAVSKVRLLLQQYLVSIERSAFLLLLAVVRTWRAMLSGRGKVRLPDVTWSLSRFRCIAFYLSLGRSTGGDGDSANCVCRQERMT